MITHDGIRAIIITDFLYFNDVIKEFPLICMRCITDRLFITILFPIAFDFFLMIIHKIERLRVVYLQTAVIVPIY